jgi:hypothetical protein
MDKTYGEGVVDSFVRHFISKLQGFAEAIADVAFCEDISRTGWVVFDLLS